MTPSVEEIRTWIVERISHLTSVPPAEVDIRVPVTCYGLDSVTMIALAADLGQWLGLRLRDIPFTDNPTTEALAIALAEHVKKKTAS
jgi:8-amino-7-oxononanoate synthase